MRELNVYSDIIPWNRYESVPDDVKGVILSGSPHSVRDADAPRPDLSNMLGNVPVLGCATELNTSPKPMADRLKPPTPGNTAAPTLPTWTIQPVVKQCSPGIPGVDEPATPS